MRSYFITWDAYETSMACSPVTHDDKPFDHGTKVYAAKTAPVAVLRAHDTVANWHPKKRVIITSITVIEDTP